MNDRLPLYRPGAVQQIPEPLYGELEAAVVRMAGLEPEQAREVVDAVLGPLRLASRPEWPESLPSCGHAFYEHDGTWHFCVEEHDEPDDRHMDAAVRHVWTTGDIRDVDTRRFD